MAVASLSPLWGGLQHGLLAGALRFVNATPDAPDYRSVVWDWALSRQACDRWDSAKPQRFSFVFAAAARQLMPAGVRFCLHCGRTPYH
jgi:hypothetical protein